MNPLLTRVRRYFGLGLKARDFPLNLAFPRISDRLKPSHGSATNLMRQLDEAKEAPAEYLGVLLAVIKHLNRCAMKPQQRLALTRDVLNLCYPVAQAQIAKHAKTGGVPEDEERKLALTRLVEITTILIISFQILFDGYYRGNNFRYARAHTVVQECASRIFELMILKQQACALRYQVLEPRDWRAVNTLFYVMSIYEDVERAFPTLQKLLQQGGARSAASLREQFAVLHIVAKFDMLRWPAHLQWVISNYVYGVENAAPVRVAVDGAPGRDELVAHCYGEKAAGLPLQNPPAPALLIDCRNLKEAIRKDCMGLVDSKKRHDAAAMPPRFARFREADHLVISDQLVRGLGNAEVDECVETETSVYDLRIFVGFSEVFDLLHHQQGEFASEDRLADTLAKRSARIAEDHLATARSTWSLLFRDDKMLRLSTQETRFTTGMNIGSLLAYGLGENINRPSLAVVVRIFRPSSREVIIDLQSIAHYAEQVLMTVNAAQQSATGARHGRAALLLFDKSSLGGWGLMFQPQDVLPGIDQIVVHRKQRELTIALGSRCNVTHDFHLYATSLTSANLGISGEPSYP
ncbi:MAG: hypothetical protein ACOYNZ_01955 [Rhodoferax sp.]